MKNHIITFVIAAFLGFAGGTLAYDIYLGVDDKDAEATEQAQNESVSKEEASAEKTGDTSGQSTASAGDNILQQKGCISCHSVGNLNLQGGATGPDLSQAFNNVEGKHGKPINEFLKEPTSAVMSSVIAGSPLSDEEINEVVEVLKQASEK